MVMSLPLAMLSLSLMTHACMRCPPLALCSCGVHISLYLPPPSEPPSLCLSHSCFFVCVAEGEVSDFQWVWRQVEVSLSTPLSLQRDTQASSFPSISYKPNKHTSSFLSCYQISKKTSLQRAAPKTSPNECLWSLRSVCESKAFQAVCQAVRRSTLHGECITSRECRV
jgi:hypothetical protein